MAVVAVLDVGKTNVKLVVFAGSEAVWQKSIPNKPLPGPPYPHANTNAIFGFLIEGLREASKVFALTDIVVTTHGATAALVDASGLVLPVMDYEYSGVDTIESLYAPERPPFTETLSPPISAGLNVGRQLFYQKERHAEAFARVEHVLFYPQFFVCWLTGVPLTEVTSVACHTDLWAIAGKSPSGLVSGQGWDTLLPPLRQAWDAVGALTPAVQAATGLDGTVRVRAGIHDSNASLLPHLARFPDGFTLASTGTWVVLMAAGGRTSGLDPARDMLAYADVRGAPVPAAKFMGGREFANIAGDAGTSVTPEDLEVALASGALALPQFVPNGGPFAGRTGRIEGKLPRRPGARVALASLYVAFMTEYLLEKLEPDAGIRRRRPLVIEGSLAGNPVYAGVLAALDEGRDVLPNASEIGTAYGASLLATWPEVPAAASLPSAAALSVGKVNAAWRRWRALVDG